MKKYWKSAAAIIVIVLSIGSFYISSLASTEQKPNFVIKPISGELPELKPIQLEGFYSDRFSDVSTYVSINAEGSSYQSQSFLNQLTGNPPAAIKELRKEHRGFMRGKDGIDNYFFEDDKYLAYANADYSSSLRTRDFKLDISLLNKENKRTTSFKVEVPEDKKIEYMYVDDVQMINGELYVITHNMVSDQKASYEEKRIYTIDASNKKIEKHESIVQIPAWQSSNYFSMQLLNTSSTKANDHLIIVKTEMKRVEDEESTREEVVSQEALSYNIVTKQLEKLNVSDLQYDSNLSFFDGSTVYFTGIKDQEIRVTPYPLADNQVGQSYSINLPVKQNRFHSYMTTIKDGKLYVAYSQMDSGTNGDVIIVELQNGETLFKGQVAVEDSKKNQNPFDLYIHELIVN